MPIELIFPAIILSAMGTVNRFMEFYVKPFVKDLQPNGKPIPRKWYSLLMSVIALIVGMVVYVTTEGIADAMVDTLLLSQFDLPYPLTVLIGGAVLWVGADFVRPLFALLYLVEGMSKSLKATVIQYEDAPPESASSQVITRGQG